MIKNISPWLETIPEIKKSLTLKQKLKTDVIIIGSGIVGLMTAWNLLKKGFKVIILEKNHIATGDTSATTGFLTRIPDASLHELELSYGREFLVELLNALRQTQQNLFKLIQENNFECEFTQCNSFYCSYKHKDNKIQNEWKTFKRVDSAASMFVPETSENLPFVESIMFENEGKFHSRKFLAALLQKMSGPNFQIFEESEVIDLDLNENVKVKTNDGEVIANKIVIATGKPLDFFRELFTITKAILTYVIAAKYKNCTLNEDLYFDTFSPYFYYRKINKNTIILGGSDVEFEKAHTQKPYEILENFLKEHLPGDFEITNKWSGSLFHTLDGLPYSFEHPNYKNKVYIGTGFGGNGLVFGTLTAEVLANLIDGKDDPRAKLLSLERTKTKIDQASSAKTITKSNNNFSPFADLKEFEKGKPVCKIFNNKKVVVFKYKEKFYALNNSCSHAGGSLCDGILENEIVECPLHNAKFDIITGKVKGPPAIRPQQIYQVRINNNMVEIAESSTIQPPPPTPIKKTYWAQILKFSFLTLIFCFLQFIFQYYFLTDKEISASLVRSFALTGATLISTSLFSSAIFKWIPKWSIHWRIRRYLGVSGFIFILFHVLSVYHFYFDYDVAAVYFSLNPLENPIIFGSIAFPILMIMALTSTDYAVEKLTPKVWKSIHRFVYLAFWASIFHFITINPSLLKNTAGYLLLLITFLALSGEFYWFIKMTARRGKFTFATLVGISIIVLYLITAYFVYRRS